MGLTYKILIVDDEDEIKKLLSAFLSETGHYCETASDGVEALARLDKLAFDAVVTDIKMPRMDGITLTRNVKHSHSEIAVMIMTGYGAE